MSRMKLFLIVLLPLGHALLFTGYYLWSRDAAGTAMSVVFAIAMGLMAYILLPTIRDVGPTAPVDPAWADGRVAGTDRERREATAPDLH
jgi:hypothetical protein